VVAKNEVDAETMYILKVKRAVVYGPSGRTILTPAQDNVVKGKVISTIADADIESIELVENPPA
jgi:hypothetical protein